ncbi:MAG: hypothetical protein EA377_11065 [Phycisphaerales bacterium]|nr:MAG: hypothetical protein EA377_11065 [Phycisphaerales bacterium]
MNHLLRHSLPWHGTSGPRRFRLPAGWACPLLAAAILTGCTSTIRTTDPPRTATEQFLLSKAAARAVEQLNVDALHSRVVYVDDEYFAASEAKFVLGELRAKMLDAGIQLVREREQAQIILEVRSGGVGIDRSDFLVGIPSIIVQAGGDTSSTQTPLATPELALLKNINQMGVASVAFVAYWADSGEIVDSSGPYIGRTMRDDWWIFGFGPRTVGNIPPTDPTDE